MAPKLRARFSTWMHMDHMAWLRNAPGGFVQGDDLMGPLQLRHLKAPRCTTPPVGADAI